jgi:BioD-like phosphotransacetylase family protein
MEENVSENTSAPQPKKNDERPEVIIVRNWKEYLGESLLIVFSVALAIILTEVFTKIHENNQTREVLHQLKQELINNNESEEIQYKYHLMVLRNIDSALHDEKFRKKFLDSGQVHLKTIAPDGVLREDLNDIAWQVAKQNNIFSKLNLETYRLLTDIYDNQSRIIKSEDEIGKLLLSFESREPENVKATLILMRDSYHAWAVDRAPALLNKYKRAIDALSNY